MKPQAKLNLVVVGYCVILWLTNWSYVHTYDRDEGLTSSFGDYRALGVLMGVIASFILARRIWRVFRDYLARGIRIDPDVRIWSGWTMLILLMPLFFGYSSHSIGVADDGASMTSDFEYGGDISLYSAAFSGLAIMLFQALVTLESYDRKQCV
jgi:hypothetical protein